METSMGKFTIELWPDEAPITVANFLKYVDEGFYDGTIFHRVIRRFVIQGGGYDRNMVKKETHDPIVNESKYGVYNDRFTLSMARTDDPDSATSQFFINLGMNTKLDMRQGRAGYAVFGKVTIGQEVAHEIGYVNTRTFAGMDDVPVQPVTIIKAYRK
jgi:cyclophilin family peptidyl-prolyl cis-trans isomerase